jgi:hypothetical protein
VICAQAPAPEAYTPPRTADGQPDLQGVWNNATLTPLERPAELGSKAFFTPQEAALYEKQTAERSNRDIRHSGDGLVAYNEAWYDRGSRVIASLRTSLITSPADGKIPYTRQGLERLAAAAEYASQHPADGPEDIGLAERCILWGTAGPPMLPGPYNDNYQIFQTAGSVVIVSEMIHDVRVIPLDGRPHLPASVRLWMGDARGHWEGNTLVIDTTNFSAKTKFRGATQDMHLIERLTRTGPETIQYEFTVADPATFTQSWSGVFPMNPAAGPIYEYACHEGNYAMKGMLAGARSQEKENEQEKEKEQAGK